MSGLETGVAFANVNVHPDPSPVVALQGAPMKTLASPSFHLGSLATQQATNASDRD